jgi:hypothetical protein
MRDIEMILRPFLLLFFLSGMLMVQAQTKQSIHFPDIPVLGYGDTNYSLNAGSSSGLSVRYVSTDATVASVSGNMVTVKKAGFTIIKAFQDGNSTYFAAEPAAQLLVVTPKATLTVTAADKTIDSGMPTPVFTYSISGFKKGETTTVVSGFPTFQPLESNLLPGTYPIVINKGTLAALNYDFQLIDGKLTVDPGTTTPLINAGDTLVRVFPNPASDYLLINYENTFVVSVFDVYGREMIRLKDVSNEVKLSLSDCDPGFYFVRIDSDNHIEIKKVLIRK